MAILCSHSSAPKISTLIYNFGTVKMRKCGTEQDWAIERVWERESEKDRWRMASERTNERYRATIPFNFNFITSLINYVVHIVRSVPRIVAIAIQTHSLSQILALTKPYWDIVSTRWRFGFHCLFTIIKFSKELISERL